MFALLCFVAVISLLALLAFACLACFACFAWFDCLLCLLASLGGLVCFACFAFLLACFACFACLHVFASRHKAPDISYNRKVKFEIPYILNMPNNALFDITYECIPHMWGAVNTNVDDQVGFRVINEENLHLENGI